MATAASQQNHMFPLYVILYNFYGKMKFKKFRTLDYARFWERSSLRPLRQYIVMPRSCR